MKTTREPQALSRLTFGSTPESRQELARRSLRDWLEEQLHPDDRGDDACARRLADLRLPIRYGAGKDWAAVDERRPLRYLDAPIETAWQLLDPGKVVPPQEKVRPRVEVVAATLVRAVYSRWQLREVLCDFWHNHFSINAWDHTTGVALPSHDRDVVRRHCLGNFRALLEASAQSPAMLLYLNNRSSRSGAPNENYARELLELHTLGRDAYLNGLYNRWREVPGALKGRPAGYIDQDVYEAARAFTGWAIEDGSPLGGGQTLPRSGRFAYVESWHDNYQKRVLGEEFDPYRPALEDGRKVLDLAAFHPATARHLASKLCRRLVADDPPASLVASTARVWQENRDKPDQIARVVAHIVSAKEFVQAGASKVKRPLELVAGYLRATGIEFTPSEGLIGEMEAAGQRLFGWLAPTGHPDLSDYWLGASAMRRRWTLIAGLTENWWGTGLFDPLASWRPGEIDTGTFAAHWCERLYGTPLPPLVQQLCKAAGLPPEGRIGNPAQARRLVAWAAMAPAFQMR